MKKSILSTFLILCLAFQAQAQLSYGAKAGASASVIIGPFNPETDSGKPVFNPHFGFFFNYKLNEKLSTQIDVNYTVGGVEYNTYVANSDTIWPIEVEFPDGIETFYIETFLAGDVSGRFDLHYIDLPMTLRWKLSKKVGLNLGARIAFLVRGSNKGTAILDIGESAGKQDDFDSYEDYVSSLFLHQIEENFDESPNINSFDVGLTLGGQYFFTERLSLGLDASYGFIPVQPQTNLITANYTNLYLTTSVAYRLGKAF